MIKPRTVHRTLSALALVAVAAMRFESTAAQPTISPLSSLTLTPERLAAGCSLRPDDRVDYRASTNPWVGTDPALIATIREFMGDMPQVPDAPLSARQATIFRLKLATGVNEAYAAHYRAAGGELVRVYAVVFERPEDERARPDLSARIPDGVRLAIGSSNVVVRGKGSACYDAVVDHVRSIAAP
jgi:hypothetical protein